MTFFFYCVFQKCMDFFSFKLKSNKTGIKYITGKKWHFLYSVILQTAISLCGYMTVIDYSKRMYKTEGDGLFFILNVLIAAVNAFSFIVCCISSKMCAKKIQKTWQTFYETEKNISRFGIMINHNFIRNYTTSCMVCTLIVAFTSAALMLIFDECRNEINPALHFVVCLYLHWMCISYGVNTHFFILLWIINDALAKTENTPKKTFLHGSCRNPTEMLETARIQQNLCELVRQTCGLLSLPLFYIF